jgi:crotonobetainyl-CoA:carnitine CoA-transferase CaiB-like acyl-CoA transferase
MMLADMGAEVIKVEPPAGDDTRYLQQKADLEACPFFLAVNRNKRGIVLDVTKPAGHAVLLRMLAVADVLMHNFRPGVAEKLGVGEIAVRAVKPDIVYCAISAFGQSGPYARRPGTDVLLQAMSGLMAVSGEPKGRPLRAGAPIIDMTIAASAAFSVLAALMHRMRTGEGSVIDASLLDQAIFMQSPQFTWAVMEGMNPPRVGNQSPLALILDLETSDGYIMVSVPSTKFWRLLATVLSRPEMAADARFRSNALRLQNQEAIRAIIGDHFRQASTATWAERLVAAGVPCGPVMTYQEVLQDPQVRNNRTFLRMNHEIAGETRVANLPFQLNCAPVEIERTPPTLGRDTDHVLQELGYSDAEIAQLRSDRVITHTPINEQ